MASLKAAYTELNKIKEQIVGVQHRLFKCRFSELLNIQTFCFDKDNNRIIMALNDDIQFAYLETI